MYTAHTFDHLLGTPGFSDKALQTHFTLYQGYVTNTNKLHDELKKLADADQLATPHFAEMKRRLGWEFNGMRLHELYFGNMVNGGKQLAAGSPLYNKITKDFGTFDHWQKEFQATGSARGIGWAILYHDKRADKLFNVWVNEHDVGHFAGATPVLIMDVFEHAFFLDYGTKRADYIAAFMKAIDWSKTEERIG
jgi:Fe-Mn family superoxide dismutase